MDYFSICFNLICLAIQGAMHISFSAGLTGKTRKARYLAVYLSLLAALEWAALKAPLPWILSIGAELLILYGVNRLLLGNRPSASWVTAILAIYISQLSFGFLNSAEAVLFPCLVGKPLLYVLVIAAAAASFGICGACYSAARKLISPEEIGQITAAGCLLFPVLFFFASEAYLLRSSYTQAALSPAPLLEHMGKHTALLFLQALGLGALLCTLYAYRQLCRSWRAQEETRSLAQAARAQRVYIAEAQLRYEQTKAFRHDVKNHLSVLAGLLAQGKADACKAYLQTLNAASAALSLPYQTGNPVVDILLAEKLGTAKEDGISAQAALQLPQTCAVDDFDLCVIFANALDNAISACRAAGGERFIRVSGTQQGDFYLLSFENSCPPGPLPPAGTGLSNIKSAAEKYRGAILTEKKDRCFSLNVLLDIS